MKNMINRIEKFKAFFFFFFKSPSLGSNIFQSHLFASGTPLHNKCLWMALILIIALEV